MFFITKNKKLLKYETGSILMGHSVYKRMGGGGGRKTIKIKFDMTKLKLKILFVKT